MSRHKNDGDGMQLSLQFWDEEATGARDPASLRLRAAAVAHPAVRPQRHPRCARELTVEEYQTLMRICKFMTRGTKRAMQALRQISG